MIEPDTLPRESFKGVSLWLDHGSFVHLFRTTRYIGPGIHPFDSLVRFQGIMSPTSDRLDCPAQSPSHILSIHISSSIDPKNGGDIVSLPSSSALANSIISLGKISGTPPTFVETTKSPVEAASMILIPKASVKEVFR